MPANLRTIRRKTRTVTNIQKITRAMYMVAAAKLRRLQTQVQNGQAYWDRLNGIISRVATHAGDASHPLLEPREAGKVGVMVIGGARGLCGSYNVSLLRRARDFIESIEEPLALMTVGPKAHQFCARHGWDVEEAFQVPDDEHRLLQANEIARILRDGFLGGSFREVHVVFTEFVTVLRHVPTTRQLLPIAPPEAEEELGMGGQSYIFEPPAEELLASLLPRAVDAQVYEMLLHSVTSEEAARMTAMSAATDNAGEMIVSLTRQFNRARQTQITTEILEIVSGAEALMAE